MASLARDMARAGALIANSRRVVIVAHENPDPDTVGSALGLAAILRHLGKDVTVAVPDTSNSSLQSIAGWSTVERDPAAQQRAVAAAGVVIAVDNTGLNRFGNLHWILPSATAAGIPTINIDHHKTNARFADVNVVDVSAAACAQVVYDLAVACAWPVTRPAADGLFAALRSDTGGFAYPGHDYGRVFRLATALAEAGADVPAIAAKQTELSEKQLRLLAEVFASTHIDNSLGFVKAVVTQAMMQRAGASHDDAYVAVVMLAALESYRLLAVLIELEPNRTRVSIRTRGVAADKIAQSLGGGGHRQAAGVTISTDVKNAEHLVAAAAQSALRLTGDERELDR